MGVNPFLAGLVSDLRHRAERLLRLIDRGEWHTDLVAFHQEVIARLNRGIADIDVLSRSRVFREEALWPYALSNYQDIARELALVEQFAIPILLRYDERDHEFLRIVRGIARETHYPTHLIPLVTTTSDQYYWAQPEMRIIGVPAGELGGLLGWGDLFHELGHVLIAAWPQFLRPLSRGVNEYFRTQRHLLADVGGSGQDSQWLALAQIKWGEKLEGTWRVEIGADLIAAYLAGPSYGWQNIRLAINYGSDPFEPAPGHVADHPADQARLNAILAMLRLLGLGSDADEIRMRWESFLKVGRHGREPQGFAAYYPPQIIDQFAELVFNGCRAEGLLPFSGQGEQCNKGIVQTIHEAWGVFNSGPDHFREWEQHAFRRITSDATLA